MKTYEKLGKCKQTEFFNVSEQNPIRKQTEAVKAYVNKQKPLRQTKFSAETAPRR